PERCRKAQLPERSRELRRGGTRKPNAVCGATLSRSFDVTLCLGFLYHRTSVECKAALFGIAGNDVSELSRGAAQFGNSAGYLLTATWVFVALVITGLVVASLYIRCVSACLRIARTFSIRISPTRAHAIIKRLACGYIGIARPGAHTITTESPDRRRC